MSARIYLPVEAHIKKYLTIQYGQVLEVSSIGTVPYMIYLMLEIHKKMDPALIRPNQKLIDNKKYFRYELYIGDGIESSRGLYLSNDRIKKFNVTLDNMMREDMFRFCEMPDDQEHRVDYNIVRFREKYGITEDEMPFENLKKWYYRERIRLKEHVRVEKRFEPQLELFY